MYTLIYQQRFTLSTWSDCRHRRWGGTQPGPAVSWRASSLAIRDSCGFTHQQPREIQGRGMWMYWGGGAQLYHLQRHRRDGMRWSASLQFRTKAAGGWGTELQAPPYSPTPAQAHPINSNSLNPCGVNGWGLWLCWVNHLVRKRKNRPTEALSARLHCSAVDSRILRSDRQTSHRWS